MSYDTKCHELAKAFLSDCDIPTQAKRDKLTDELAQAIQTAIEDYIEAEVTP